MKRPVSLLRFAQTRSRVNGWLVVRPLCFFSHAEHDSGRASGDAPENFVGDPSYKYWNRKVRQHLNLDSHWSSSSSNSSDNDSDREVAAGSWHRREAYFETIGGSFMSNSARSASDACAIDENLIAWPVLAVNWPIMGIILSRFRVSKPRHCRVSWSSTCLMHRGCLCDSYRHVVKMYKGAGACHGVCLFGRNVSADRWVVFLSVIHRYL